MTQIASHKYLDYWWDPSSEINPSHTKEDYFKVFYDEQGRYIAVERYDTMHHLQSHDKFFWKKHAVIRVEQYDPWMKMEKYIVYKYGPNGELLGREHFAPDGTWLSFEPTDK